MDLPVNLGSFAKHDGEAGNVIVKKEKKAFVDIKTSKTQVMATD